MSVLYVFTSFKGLYTLVYIVWSRSKTLDKVRDRTLWTSPPIGFVSEIAVHVTILTLKAKNKN